MARTFLRQEQQIRNSLLYDDTVAPTEAAYETNPTNIETDLNNIRSMLSYLKDIAAGNWWDNQTAPTTLENGSTRGVDDLNDALHAVEKKRILRQVTLLTDITVTASVAATQTLTSSGVWSDEETVTIGSRTYTMQSPFVDAVDNIDASGSTAQTHENLRRAINGDGVAGTNYGTGTTVHADVTAADTATTNIITARAEGTAANLIATTQSSANALWGAATMTGGAGGDVEILGTGELPTNTTAAVAAVTTLGTVVDPATNFLTAGLDEVAGLHALSPKNMVALVDASTGDPILTTGVGESTSGKRVWGLLQGESGLTDGTTITDSTDTRVQISFVIANDANDDLELVDGEEMGGKSINYHYRERVRLEDLSEGDFLNTAAVDVGAGAVTPTRQLSYDNQGTTAVNVTTTATLDLEGPGLTWAIRDDLEADLFKVIEGSSGGTSVVEISAGVDTFDVDAVVNDFLNGASFDTGSAGTTINVGVTANQIDAGGALTVKSGGSADLNLEGDLELNLTDSYRSGSSWSLAAGISLADASADWDNFETEFGEVSLLAAIVQASNVGGITKVCANVSTNTNADTDVSNSDSNLDAALGDLSGGSFVGDHDCYLNGQLLRSGANAAANNDVYPGTDLDNTSDAQLKFEFKLKAGDVICILSRVSTA